MLVLLGSVEPLNLFPQGSVGLFFRQNGRGMKNVKLPNQARRTRIGFQKVARDCSGCSGDFQGIQGQGIAQARNAQVTEEESGETNIFLPNNSTYLISLSEKGMPKWARILSESLHSSHYIPYPGIGHGFERKTDIFQWAANPSNRNRYSGTTIFNCLIQLFDRVFITSYCPYTFSFIR